MYGDCGSEGDGDETRRDGVEEQEDDLEDGMRINLSVCQARRGAQGARLARPPASTRRGAQISPDIPAQGSSSLHLHPQASHIPRSLNPYTPPPCSARTCRGRGPRAGPSSYAAHSPSYASSSPPGGASHPNPGVSQLTPLEWNRMSGNRHWQT